MADPHLDLSVLVDPPLAEPPPVAELERRARARRRRTAGGGGALVALVAVIVIGAGMALRPGDEPQAVQTAAPAGSTSLVPQAGDLLPVMVRVKAFMVDGQEWTLFATRTADPAICFTLQQALADVLQPGCLTPDGRSLQAAAADLGSVSFVYGIVAPDVSSVVLTADGNASKLDIMVPGRAPAFPVSFVGAVVGPSVTTAELIATRNGKEDRVAVPLPPHLRVSAVHGRDTPPTPPSTTATTVRSTPTTLAPDTPVSTVVPPTTPAPTTPPGVGQPKRVQPVAGATDLRKQRFESAAASGAQSVAVRFWNGVEPCSVLGKVDVAETAASVTITLWTGLGPGAAGMACIQLAGYYEVLVPLQAPLGGRTVVDGAA